MWAVAKTLLNRTAGTGAIEDTTQTRYCPSTTDNLFKNCFQIPHIWLLQVVGDGLAAQEGNPEVEVDISRPDVQINEQIFALKLATNKLDAAYNGHTVEWPHYEPSG